MVTVEGLHYCLGGKSTLDLLACVLAFMAKREKAFVPTSSQPDLVVRFDEVKNELGLSSLELAQARVLVSQFEPRASRGNAVKVRRLGRPGRVWAVLHDG